jgi:hypothetical protein
VDQQTINLSHEQTQKAAAAGAQLLQTQGAVNVPGPMAVSGIIGALNSLLTAIASGQVLVVNAPTKKAEGSETPPEGDGEKKPDLKTVDTGKQAEK